MNAVFLSCEVSVTNGQLAGSRVDLVRYHYPSFRRESVVPLDGWFRGEVVEAPPG